MDPLKEVRWRQRFDNFEKAYHTLCKYHHKLLETELERAGFVQLFEVTFELAWKVLKDYVEAEGYDVKSPRESIKTAFQSGLIDKGHVWMDALSNRNLAAHTYDEVLVEKFVEEIRKVYLPELRNLYERLSKDR